MNTISMFVILWGMRLIILFPLISSIAKANIKGGKLPLPLKIMTIHLALAFFLQASISTLAFLHVNHGFLFHIYIVEEFVMDMLFYRELLKKTHPYKDEPTKRNIFLVAIALFSVFAVINVLFINNLNQFPTYTFSVQCIVMAICTIKYNYTRSFYEPTPLSYVEQPSFKLYKGPVFWINTGKLVYFLTSFPVFVLYSFILQTTSKEIATATWAIQNISIIVLHIFMGIGFLKFSSNPNKVLDMEGHFKKLDNESKRKLFKENPDFAKLVKEDATFQDFRNDNPDLFLN